MKIDFEYIEIVLLLQTLDSYKKSLNELVELEKLSTWKVYKDTINLIKKLEEYIK